MIFRAFPYFDTGCAAYLKRWDPMLSMPREAFIEALSVVPAQPPAMEAILAFNRGAREEIAR
jgi:hypothetical protein